MSNRAAGQRFELRIKHYLEGLGCVVEKARPMLKWIGPKRCISSPYDFFGAADLVAVHPAWNYTLFIQATRGDVGPRKTKCEAVPWNLEVQRVQIWTPQDGMQGGIRALMLRPGKKWDEAFFRMRNGLEGLPPNLL